MARYQDAIDWIVNNDDTEWAENDADTAMGTESVTASLVAGVFNKEIKQVREDVIRGLKRLERESSRS